MTTAVATSVGPLTTTVELPPESALFGARADAAAYVAFVLLDGRYAALAEQSYWRRWNGQEWRLCHRGEAHSAVRRALHGVYDRRLAQNPSPTQVMQLVGLLDVNWSLGAHACRSPRRDRPARAAAMTTCAGCNEKGCPWRGTPSLCPMHGIKAAREADAAWDSEYGAMMRQRPDGNR